MPTSQQTPTFKELQASLQTAIHHPVDTGWMIYHYIREKLPTLTSEEARTLMATYTKMHIETPSLLHSCILMVALKMSERYNDFKLTSFLYIWGYPQNLRDEDKQKQTDKGGKTYLSLQERTENAVKSYLLHHSEERNSFSENDILTMMAVKVFTTERNGRKLNTVKLIAGDGQEMIAEQHQFPCKPWEIAGRMFDVLTRLSKNDNVRVQEIVVSTKQISEVFPIITGYVDRFDSQYGHYHVFDNMSRHFVAENPKIIPQIGGFVEFAAVVPSIHKFKVAVITKVLGDDEGVRKFGIYDAYISYINIEHGYFYYKITSETRSTSEGEITTEGSAQLAMISKDFNEVKVGTSIRILMFLKRGKDGKKRNHVAKIF